MLSIDLCDQFSEDRFATLQPKSIFGYFYPSVIVINLAKYAEFSENLSKTQ